MYGPSVPPDNPRQQPAQAAPAAPSEPLEPTQEEPDGPFVQRLGPFQRPPPTVDEAPSDRPAYVAVDRDAFAKLHYGFYLRLSGGVGSLSDSARTNEFDFTVDGEAMSAGRYRGTASGVHVGTEVSMGYATALGLVVGLGIYTATLANPEVDDPKYKDEEIADQATRPVPQRVSQLAIAGPFLDFYFDKRAGFHTAGAFGLSTFIAGQSLKGSFPRTRGHVTVGLGFVLGVGYDWWVGDEWSLGLLARVAYGWSSGSDPQANQWTHRVLAPAALISLTYN